MRAVPPGKVSRFQKPDPAKWTQPRMAVISYTEDGASASCNCGAQFHHTRTKVLEDKIDRHLSKRHGGMGLRI